MPSELARHWSLDPRVTHLNHGSFGATPRVVLEAQDEWRRRVERDPVAFFARDLEPALDGARQALAAFVGAQADDLAFVPNVTSALSTVLRSLELRPGDELLTTDHAYGAARNALEWAAAHAGARVVVAQLPYPATPAGIIETVVGRASARTRLALVDHVTSPTSLVLPVAALVRQLAAAGVDTLVDGAHAPGMLALDLDALGAAYYAGNGHKWLFGPKGSAFLHVRRDRQPATRPLAISHGASSPRRDRSRFRLEFDFTGTADYSAFLALPAAIRFGQELVPGGWAELRARGHRLALEAAAMLQELADVESPPDAHMTGSMVSVPLPPTTDPPELASSGLYADSLYAALQSAGGRVQVAVSPWPQRPRGAPWRRLLRVSAAPYNAGDDVVRLRDALGVALATA